MTDTEVERAREWRQQRYGSKTELGAIYISSQEFDAALTAYAASERQREDPQWREQAQRNQP